MQMIQHRWRRRALFVVGLSVAGLTVAFIWNQQCWPVGNVTLDQGQVSLTRQQVLAAAGRPPGFNEILPTSNKGASARVMPQVTSKPQREPEEPVRILDTQMHHLRIGGEREWADFPKEPEGPNLVLRFRADRNAAERTLRLRQQDVKQTWKVLLNAKEIGRLVTDENDMVVYFAIPPERLTDGDNVLRIEQSNKTPDDIRVGDIALDSRAADKILAATSVEIQALDGGSADPAPMPCRLTVLNAQGSLMTVGANSGGHLAVRPGVIYTGTGTARFGLPPGDYTIYAGRGFEYGIDYLRVSLRPGDVVRKQLKIRREVATEGYVSCDTHVHSLTHSGHGDATIEERVLAIAGEGIELPIATEHNRQIDYSAAATAAGIRRHFTPVVGNEVTTAVGHFNIFPVKAGGPVPDEKLKEWKTIFDSIAARTGAPVVILNHPRDLHSGFRPFGPERHNAATGEDLTGWVLQANAMEVMNSGAQQSDAQLLFRDWFAMLNRGNFLTPVGASDSHDVSRYIVGQARTYVRCRCADPGKINVAEAVASFQKGSVLVSCGLLTEISINDKYGPGDLVPATDELKVTVRVLGPGWTSADHVELFANGTKIREAQISDGKRAGLKWSGEWRLPRFEQDVFLTAMATGPGVRELYWPIAKPYQPTSPRVEPRVIGATGAIWLDSDGDGKRTCAFDYAQQILQAAGNDPVKTIDALAKYDEAVATQAAGLLQSRGVSVQDAALRQAARKAGQHVERGFQAFAEAWRDCQIAQSKRQ